MRAIRLDYAASSLASVSGVAVFIVATGCALITWQYASALHQQSASVDLAVAQARRDAGIDDGKAQAAQPRALSSAATTADMQQAQQVAAFLLVPWSALFNALESAALDDAVLLSIEPDAKKQQLTIIAEAKNRAVLFSYIQRLEATPQLSRVYMLKHEVLQDVAQQPIRFVLTATWTKTP